MADLWPPPPLPVAAEAPAAGRAHLPGGAAVPLADDLLARLGGLCPLDQAEPALVEAGRDWWPLALHWALAGQVPALPAAVARPTTTAQVAAILRVCDEARVPVTPAGGRSGVCGGSVPKAGGVALDLRGLTGISWASEEDGLVAVRAGTNGLAFEEQLRAEHGMTVGHWPQSMALASVGGWVACRGAGQYSTRYGKVEDMVQGLEVVLADGRMVATGGRAPRSAVGPDLNQVFLGSEGTLGVVTEATMRAWPVPAEERRSAWTFATFSDGIEACRRVLRRGATPAVLRLYDGREGARFGGDGERSVLLVLDEGDGFVVDATMTVVAEEAGALGAPGDVEAVGRWLEHRNDVSALGQAVGAGVVVDTCEIAARWSALPDIHAEAVARFEALPGAAVISCHQSHAYLDGACLYFTFAGFPPPEATESFYAAAWEAIEGVTLGAGGALSHHHGVGLLRAPLVRAALGGAYEVLVALKAALDPHGTLNPGGLGLPSPHPVVAWPAA
ncbi:MAG: FAD-binding oxidoreductase [Acidimicrobiales bacterium]